jgi:hypothetical protein
MKKSINDSFCFPLDKEETMARFEQTVRRQGKSKSSVIVELIERFVEEEKNAEAGKDHSAIGQVNVTYNSGSDPYKLIAALDNWMVEHKDNDDIKFFATISAKSREFKDFTWSKYNTLQMKQKQLVRS